MLEVLPEAGEHTKKGYKDSIDRSLGSDVVQRKLLELRGVDPAPQCLYVPGYGVHHGGSASRWIYNAGLQNSPKGQAPPDCLHISAIDVKAPAALSHRKLRVGLLCEPVMLHHLIELP